MTNTQIDRRDYGRLEAQVERLTQDVHALKETVQKMHTMMAEARGGWRVLMLIGGVSGTIGAAATWVVSHLSFKGTP